MLYPLTAKQESFRSEDNIPKEALEEVWFTKQRIGNACGTIGLLHSLMNAPEPLNTFQEGSWLESFQSECHKSMSPVEKAQRLEADDKVAKMHDDATSSEANQTQRGKTLYLSASS